MSLICAIERADGGVSVKIPNWNKYTLDPAEEEITLGRVLDEGPGILGSIKPMDAWLRDLILERGEELTGSFVPPSNSKRLAAEVRDVKTNPRYRGFVVRPGKELIPDLDAWLDAECAKRAVFAGYTARVVGETAILPHRGNLRNAWRMKADKGGVEMDMAKAREIKTDLIRAARAPRLEALDVEYMRAIEAGDTARQSDIAAKKQTLRDLPVTVQPDLEAIADPAALDAFEPVWP